MRFKVPIIPILTKLTEKLTSIIPNLKIFCWPGSRLGRVWPYRNPTAKNLLSRFYKRKCLAPKRSSDLSGLESRNLRIEITILKKSQNNLNLKISTDKKNSDVSGDSKYELCVPGSIPSLVRDLIFFWMVSAVTVYINKAKTISIKGGFSFRSILERNLRLQ